tara:strand:- start:1039 stop:1239 length:201 start_codon:yes stop_codon:yes gene_type:complete
MNEEQLRILDNIRNAVNDLYDKLEVELYEKKDAVKVTYKKVNPTELVSDNLGYIVKSLNQLKNGEV